MMKVFSWLWGATCLAGFLLIAFWDVGTASTFGRVVAAGIFFLVVYVGGLFFYWGEDDRR